MPAFLADRIANAPLAAAYALLAAAVLLTVGIYWVHAGDFFVFDSVDVIGTNVGLQFNAGEFDRWRVAALSSDRGLFNRPLSNLSFALDAQLAGAVDARWMKLTNILLHSVIAFLAWQVFKLALSRSPLLAMDETRARWLAAITVALWVAHPLHVSTVLYTVQRMAQLSTLFIVAGLWFYTRRRVRWLEQAPDAAEISSTLLGLTVFSLLAVLGKGNGALLPLYVAALELGLFRGRAAGGRVMLPVRLSQLALGLPLLLIALLLFLRPEALVELYAQRDFGPVERMLTQLRALWQYLAWTVLLDVNSLGVFQDDFPVSRSLLQPWTTALALGGWLGIAGLAWWLRARAPLVGFALLWYLAGHSMESTLIPLELVFEHRNYLPSMGPLLLVGWLLISAPRARYGWAGVGAAAALAVLSSVLFIRTADWSSELMLAETQVRHHPESLRSRLHLANVQVGLMAGQRNQRVVREHFMAARELHWGIIQQDQNYVPSLFSLIYLESLARRPEEVQRLYRQLLLALRQPGVTPTDVSSLQQLLTCLGNGSCFKPTGGTRAFLQQLLSQLDSTATRELLMRHCLSVRDHACVQEQAEAALAMDPEFVYAYLALYMSSMAAGERDGAQVTALRMLKFDPLRQQLYGIRDSAGAGQ